MIWVDKIRSVAILGWIILLLFIILASAYIGKFFAWILTGLYRFFIGSEDHVAPV